MESAKDEIPAGPKPWKTISGVLYIALYSSIYFLYVMTFMMIYPLMSLRLLSLNVSQSEIGFIFACGHISMGLFSNLMGYMSAKIGRIYIVLIGAGSNLVFNAVTGFATHVAVYYIMIIVFGLAGAAVRTSLLAVIDRQFGRHATDVMSIYEFAGGVGYTIGPLYGATIYESTREFYAPYLINAGILFIIVLCLIPSVRARQEEQKVKKKDPRLQLTRVNTGKHIFQNTGSDAHVLRHPLVYNALLQLFAVASVWNAISTTLSLYLLTFSLSVTTIGFAFLVLSLGYTLGVPCVGKVMNREVNKLSISVLGTLCTGVTFFMISSVILKYYGDDMTTVTMVIVWNGISGVAMAFMWIPVAPILMEVTSDPYLGFEDKTDFLMGFYSIVIAIGAGVGSALGSVLAEFYDFGTSMLISAAMCWLLSLPGILHLMFGSCNKGRTRKSSAEDCDFDIEGYMGSEVDLSLESYKNDDMEMQTV